MDTTKTTTTTKPPLSPSDLHPIYNQIKTYPFSTDNEFQSGLRVILSTPLPTLTSEIRTRTLQAQCFYISRKNNIIPHVDVEGYTNWLREMGEEWVVPGEQEKEEGAKGGGGDDDLKNLSTNNISTTTTAGAAASEPHGPPTNLLSSATTTTTTETPPPPPYPQSFSNLVELITTGQPIPGLKVVPNTLLTGQGSKAVESKRKKPWEVHREEEMEI